MRIGIISKKDSLNPLIHLLRRGFIDHTHTSFQGRALAIVCAGLQEGNIHVAVSAEGCETYQLMLDVVETSRGVRLVVVDRTRFED